MIRKRKKLNNQGFTLVEIILALAIFSIAALFVMQMFVSSNNMGQTNASNQEKLRRSINISEMLKSSNSIDEFTNSMYINTGYPLPVDDSQDDMIKTYIYYYDDNYMLTSYSECTSLLKISITREIPTRIISGEYYYLNIEFFDIDDGEQSIIVDLNPHKYYPHPFMEVNNAT